MKWTDALAIGNATIDEQHQGLFRCLDELETATAEKRTLLAVYSITRLKHYVREHFETEEAIMKACNYPRLQEHIMEHEKFRLKMLELQGKAIILDVSTEMVEFLTDWLLHHVTKSDMEYVSYLKE